MLLLLLFYCITDCCANISYNDQPNLVVYQMVDHVVTLVTVSLHNFWCHMGLVVWMTGSVVHFTSALRVFQFLFCSTHTHTHTDCSVRGCSVEKCSHLRMFPFTASELVRYGSGRWSLQGKSVCVCVTWSLRTSRFDGPVNLWSGYMITLIS